MKNTFASPGESFAGVLLNGLRRMRENGRLGQWTFLLLEDLVPLWRVNHTKIQEVIAIAEKHSMQKVSFLIPEELQNDLESEEIEGQIFKRVTKSGRYQWPNTLQPSLWDSRALIRTCQACIENYSDPWSFEHYDPGEGLYAAPFNWSTVFHGFYHMGKINRSILPHLRRYDSRECYNYFLMEYIRTELRYQLMRIPNKIKEQIR
ncbi:MAG: hypothetical protein MK080_12230 [Opitutales bacterium]|nr:hypothetical protein [Opitutales bacterium]